MIKLDSFAIVRSLEMLLDQLYYWAQRADESRTNADDPGLPADMLHVATTNLETFVTTLLDCYRPLELVPTRMPVSDLLSAIVVRARGEMGAASVTTSGEADEIVSVGLAQLTRAVSVVLQRLDPRGAALHVTVARTERAGRRAVEIALRSNTKPLAAAPRHGTAELEWALARRIVALHAGELQERVGSRGQTIVLFLPAEP